MATIYCHATHGYRAGTLSECTSLLSRFYAATLGLDRSFESETAQALQRFIDAFDARHDGFWTVRDTHDQLTGCLVLDGGQRRAGKGSTATLRSFFLAEALRGQGLGRRLLEGALAFARRAHYREVTLYTHHRLQAAVKLYETAGFRHTGDEASTRWGTALTFRQYRLQLTPARVEPDVATYDSKPAAVLAEAA